MSNPVAARIRAPLKGKVKEIKVFGHRDPRGPDNNIYVWVDEQDHLHIKVLKAQRCYRFKEVQDTPGYVEIIQE